MTGVLPNLLEFAGVLARGSGFLLKEVHCPELCAGGDELGGGAKGFDQVLELCSDQPIIVFAIYVKV